MSLETSYYTEKHGASFGTGIDYDNYLHSFRDFHDL